MDVLASISADLSWCHRTERSHITSPNGSSGAEGLTAQECVNCKWMGIGKLLLDHLEGGHRAQHAGQHREPGEGLLAVSTYGQADLPARPVITDTQAGHRHMVVHAHHKPSSVVLAPVSSTSDEGEWFAGYVGRVAALTEEALRLNAHLAGQWGARSLQDSEWTVDTLTADLIEAWDHLTPLAEQGLELWLEFVQQTKRPGNTS